MSTTTSIHVRGIEKSFKDVHVLRGVDFDVTAGSIFALLGSNGAGKTTLLRALSGVQPITRGEVRFLGERIERLAPHRRVQRGACVLLDQKHRDALGFQ
jgi:branched-chain amino acid transport system ATP-binding protein